MDSVMTLSNFFWVHTGFPRLNPPSYKRGPIEAAGSAVAADQAFWYTNTGG